VLASEISAKIFIQVLMVMVFPEPRVHPGRAAHCSTTVQLRTPVPNLNFGSWAQTL